MPRAVHIHVHRIPAADLPMAQQRGEAFLARSFERKEARLRQFYVERVPLQGTKQGTQQESGYARAALATYTQGMLCMALTAAAVVAAGRWLSPWLFWGYVAGVTGATLVVVHRLEGWDSLELRLDGGSGGRKGKAA